MLSQRFTILELTDLALRVPEIGSVNFNILHTVLTTLILELELDGLKPACLIHDETLAQAAITKARLEHPERRKKASKILDIKEMKEKVKALVQEEQMATSPAQEQTVSDTKSTDVPEDNQVAEQTIETQISESSFESSEGEEIANGAGTKDEKFEEFSSKETEKALDESKKEVDEVESKEMMVGGEKDELSETEKALDESKKEADEVESKEMMVGGEKDEILETEKALDESKQETGEVESKEIMVGGEKDEILETEKALGESKQETDEVESKEMMVGEENGKLLETEKALDESKQETDEVESKEITIGEEKDELTESGQIQDVEKVSKSKEEMGEDEYVTEKVRSDSELSEKKADEMTIDELQESARNLMEQSADIFVEKVAVVTDALKILEDEDLLDSEPARVMEEVWRATNINRRMEAAEEGLRELSAIMDVMLDKVQDMEEQSDDVMNKTKTMLSEIGKFLERLKILEENSKTYSLRIDDCNEQRVHDVKRLEDMIDELSTDHEGTKAALENLRSSHDDLAERVVYKEDLEEAKSEVYDVLEMKLKEIRKLLRQVEDTLVKKEDFVELTNRVEELEESKVSREELGRLLEPGFIDSFLEEQTNLRNELMELIIQVTELEENLNELKTRIDEEIVKTMESNFADINNMLEKINAKLALLDPDEINDSFVNLEEQAAMIIKELEEMKAAAEQFQKEAKINFNKISNVNDLLNRLDKTKADKTKMYELLELKADIGMLMNKLDRSEFLSVVGDMKENLKRLTITVKINEEEMNHNFMQVRQELTLKMYTEDFITATQPIRNRIKALMYELERVKQICLTHLFPDAPGVVKCISCKRGAHLAGPKYLGDANVELLQEVPSRSNIKITSSKSSKYQSGIVSDASETKLPPIDLDSVPIPPPDKPREKDARRLPVLFATARPNIGLAHEKRRSAIDKKLAAYFTTRRVRPCAGEYTRTLPQQRGIAFTTVKMPQIEKEEVLLPGIDRKIYRGAIYDRQEVEEVFEDSVEQQEVAATEDQSTIEKPVISSLKEPKGKKGFIKPKIRPCSKKPDTKACVSPTIVSLHVDNEPLQKTSPYSKSRQSLYLPSNQL